MLGFNPISAWHAGQYWPLSKQLRYPGSRQLYSARRVSDWLALLDFEVEQLSYYGFVLPGMADVSQTQGPQRWLAPLGQAYMIFARKRVVPVTPLPRRWATIPKLGPGVMPEARIQQKVAQSQQ